MRLALTVAGAAVVVGAVAVLGLFLWLRTYAPLSGTGSGSFGPGPGLGADVEPTFGSGGKTVYLPVYRQGEPFDPAFTGENTGRLPVPPRVPGRGKPFDTAFTVENTGRFAVTLTGIRSSQAGPIYAEKLYATD